MRSKPVVRFSLWSNLMTGDRGQRYGGAQSVYVNDIKNRGCSQRNEGNNEVKSVCRFVGKMGFQAFFVMIRGSKMMKAPFMVTILGYEER